jgi:hypothetical protein
MIIKRRTAQRLIKSGKAAYLGNTTTDNKTYLIIERYDMQRTDHVLVTGYHDSYIK